MTLTQSQLKLFCTTPPLYCPSREGVLLIGLNHIKIMADKKGAPRPKISRETIMRALKKTGYNQTYAAKELGKSRRWLTDKMREDVHLKQMFDDARELVLDDAECELHKLVKSGDFNAIKFTLSTRGRGRGFGTSIEVTGDSVKPIEIKATMPVEEAARLFAEFRDQK